MDWQFWVQLEVPSELRVNQAYWLNLIATEYAGGCRRMQECVHAKLRSWGSGYARLP